MGWSLGMDVVATDFHNTIVWIQEGVSIWSPLESGSRHVTSTRTVLGRVERGARRVGVWFPNSTNRLLVKLNGLRQSFLCMTTNRYTQNCAQVPYRFKGHKSAGKCAESADFHNTAQIINVKPLLSSGGTQIDYPWKRIKTSLVALIESPYTTLYQTLRTCHDISSDEVA